MARWHRSPEALEAAKAWRDRCWMSDESILSDKSLWTMDNLEYLNRYFVKNLDESSRGFLEKLQDQLDPTPPGAKQLAAEILWILYLSVSDTSMKGATKRLQIRQVWEWSGEPLPDSPMLGAPLDLGFANPGTGFQTNRWREFAFCVELAREWKWMSASAQHAMISNPWEFAGWVDRHPAGTNRQFRHMLLYLLFPDYFERVMTGSHKEQILQRLAPKFGVDVPNLRDRTAVDQALHRLRPRLEQHYKAEVVDYYEIPVRTDWLDSPTGQEDPAVTETAVAEAMEWQRKVLGGSRVWLLAPAEGARLWPEFQRDGIAAIGWDALAGLSALPTYEAVYDALRSIHGGNPTNDANACYQFAHEIRPGDYIIAKQGRSVLLGYGEVLEGYRYDESRSEYRHVVKVRWSRTGRWTLPPEHRMVVKTLTDMTPYPRWLRAAFGVMNGDLAVGQPPQPRKDPGHSEPGGTGTDAERREPLDRVPDGASGGSPGGISLPGGALFDPQPTDEPAPPYGIDEALDELFLTPEQFTSILDELGRKKNVILEGAPGVGKTFVARRIAWALLGQRDNSRVQMVQFHQSYGYEDFIQGWRPRENGFGLQDGVFHRFCKRAEADPTRNYVFIIDEINRGNLSKVFGELMMLIEADKRGPGYAVPLAYSPGELFSVPENLYLLGMMNTADRSLAMVDYALRRRFSFIRLQPAFAADRFTDYLTELGATEDLVRRIVTGMGALNQAIAQDTRNLGPGYEIGHSFFVPGDGSGTLDDAWYERVIRQEIVPLLNEYWFGREDRVHEQVERLLS
jgi:5-methylcytosine-specific restriction enzyme B